MDYMALAVAIACGTFWYKGAEMENIPPLYWAGPSIVISAIVILGFGRGWIAALLAQLGMIAAVTVYRAMKGQGEK